MLTKKVIKAMPKAFEVLMPQMDAKEVSEETIKAIRASKFEAGFEFPNIPNIDWLFNVLHTLKPDHYLFGQMHAKLQPSANPMQQQQQMPPQQNQQQQQQQQAANNANKPKNSKVIDIDTIKNKYKTLDEFHEALSKAGF